MNRNEILKGYTQVEERLLVAKVLDKITAMKTKNIVTYTDFLDMGQNRIIETMLQQNKEQQYLFFGGFEKAERTMLFFCPEKWTKDFARNLCEKYIKIITITLPKELQGEYTHKDYLGGLMKLGIKREKIGDILVFSEGADIVTTADCADYLTNNLQSLTRFAKSIIEEKEITFIREPIEKKETKNCIIPSLRLDSLVSELINVSRSKAEEIINQERVFVNFKQENKNSKILKEEDILTIRGKGRFKIESIIGRTKKDNIIVEVSKYI